MGHSWTREFSSYNEVILQRVSSSFNRAIAAILVYDVTKRETFESLPTWLNETLTTGKNSIVLLMIGNKTDLTEKRQVTTKEAQEFARANKILFMETSAKNGVNIEKVHSP